MTDALTIDRWLSDTEGENLEFKKASTHFGLDELTEYCVALANERGGRIILKCNYEDLESLSTEQWLALEAFSHEREMSGCSWESLDRLRELRLIERVSGDRYILPRLYYEFLDRESTYERLREKEVKKELLETFLSAYRVDGAPISEVHSVLPDEDPRTIRRMLIELQDERRIHASGEKRWTRYFPGSSEG